MASIMITLERRCLRVVTLPNGETHVRADEGLPGPVCDGASFERVDLAHGRVALRVPDGRYLARHLVHPAGHVDRAAVHRAATDGPGVTLVEELSLCTAFEELLSADGSVSLRGCDLRFLGVNADGGVVADRVADGSWERFRYLDVPAAPAVPLQGGYPLERIALTGS